MATAVEELAAAAVNPEDNTDSTPSLSIVDGEGQDTEGTEAQASGEEPAQKRSYITLTEPVDYSNGRFGEDLGVALVVRIHSSAADTFTMPNLVGALAKHVEKLGLKSDVEVTRARDKSALATFFYVDTEASQATRKASGVRERSPKPPREDLGLPEITRVLNRMHKFTLDEAFIADAKASGATSKEQIDALARTRACTELNYSEAVLADRFAALKSAGII